MAEPKLKLRGFSPPQPGGRAAWFGCLAGLLSRLRFRRAAKITSGDLRTHDYPASTQRMGLRFTERIRDTFRFRWLKRAR